MSFEKFTDKARKVLVLAQDEARALHQPYVGTEHILLGLIQEKDGLAAQALERLGVGLRRRGAGHPRGGLHRRGRRRVRPSLVHPARQARAREQPARGHADGADPTSPPSICCSASCARARARRSTCSSRLGVSGDDVRTALNDLVGQSPVYAGPQPRFDGGRRAVPDSALKEFGTDLTQKARERQARPGHRPRRRRSSASCRSSPAARRTTRCSSASPASARPPWPRAWPQLIVARPGARHPARQAPAHAGRVRPCGRHASTAASSRTA